MSSPTPSVLLDLDGTLIDSQAGILSSYQAALRTLGHVPEPTPDLSAIIGPPIEDVMRLLLEPYGDDRVAEAVAAYRADYGQNGLFGSLPYSGVAQALAEMRRSGAQLYLATSKRTTFALRIPPFSMASMAPRLAARWTTNLSLFPTSSSNMN